MANGKSTDLTPEIITSRQWAAGKRFGQPTQPDDWFGPGQPLPAAAPPSVKGRQFDYPVGTNLAYIPRGDQGISFAQLRALAQNCDLVRLVIETRKDQLCKLKWTVKPSEDAVAAKGETLKSAEAQAQKAKKLLKRPDRVYSFNQWLRMALDDMMVIDATSIYCRPTNGGELKRKRGAAWAPDDLYSLDLIDGATIRPVIDEGGRTPEPPDPAYLQVDKGVVAAHFDREELLYFPRNPLTWRVYGFSPVEQIVLITNIILRRQFHLLEYFTDGNLPDALLEVPEGWSVEQIREWQEYWDSLMAGNTAQRRKGRWVPKGMVPHQIKEVDLKTPVEEWFARVVCYCFSVSPQPFVQTINRATAETAQQAALAEGLAPVMEWVSDGLNLCLNGHGYDLVEFAWEEDTSIDPAVQSEIDDRDVRNGIRLRSQIRAERGLENDGVPDFILVGNQALLVADIGKEPETPPEPGEIPPSPPLPKGEDKGAPAGKPAPPAPGAEKQPEETPPPPKLEKAAKGKKKVVIKPLNRERPAVKKGRTALKKLMLQALAADRIKIAAQLAQGLKLAKAAADDQDLIDKILKKLRSEAIDATVDEVKKILARMAQDGAQVAFAQIGFDDQAIVTQVNKLAVEWADNRAGELVTKIEESTRDYLRADVTQAVDEGWSSQQLADKLAENFGFSEGRSETIARTEIAFADCQGNYMAYQNSGVVQGKEWLLGSEHDDDDDCDQNADAGVIPLDEAFPSGDQTPPAHPRCVCDFLPVVEEQEKE